MDCRRFEITLISANDLENVRTLGNMKVHARVSIGSSSPDDEKRTPTDTHGGTNPAWNYTMRYNISESMVQHYNTMLVVKLYCKRKLGDRYIGEVHTCMKELFDHVNTKTTDNGSAVMSFPVMRGCIPSQGVMRFCYRFGEKVVIDKMLLAESVGGWSRLC